MVWQTCIFVAFGAADFLKYGKIPFYSLYLHSSELVQRFLTLLYAVICQYISKKHKKHSRENLTILIFKKKEVTFFFLNRKSGYLFFFNFLNISLFNWRLITLQYCIAFAIHWHESTTGVHVLPMLNPPPTSLPIPSSGSSQCTSPEHPVSCIEPGLAIRFTYDIIHVLMPFSQIIPPSPSPTESKRLFYTSVSLLLSHIQDYRYHLSKFHIYEGSFFKSKLDFCSFHSLNYN